MGPDGINGIGAGKNIFGIGKGIHKTEKQDPVKNIEMVQPKSVDKTEESWKELMGLEVRSVENRVAQNLGNVTGVIANEFEPEINNPELYNGLEKYLATLPQVPKETRFNVANAVNSFDANFGDMEEFLV